VVRDDTDDMIGHVAYHYLCAALLGHHFDVPPELTEEEQLAVAVIVDTSKTYLLSRTLLLLFLL
jgi:hypothetical protein